MSTKPAPTLPAAVLRRRKPRYPAALTHLAWWAWLTIDDDGVAEQLDRFLEDSFPPWRDRQRWFLGGLFPGLLLGGLTAWPLWLLAPDEPRLLVVALLVPMMFVATALSGRDRRGETAAMFARRIAALALHAPYVWALALSAALLMGGAERDDSIYIGLAWVGALGLLVGASLAWRGITPMLFVDDHDAIWPPVAGIDSLLLRVLAGSLAIVAAFALAPWWVWPIVLLPAVAALATLPRQDHWWARWAEHPPWPAARRVGARPRVRRRYAPPPFALEAALFAQKEAKDDWDLAAVYCDARDYPPEALGTAARGLWSGAGTSLERARAAALCALLQWSSADSSSAAAHRGFTRLETLARQRAAALDVTFWEQFDRRVADPGRRAALLSLLFVYEATLPVHGLDAWRLARRLRWLEAAACAPRDSGEALLRASLEVQERLASAQALCEWWDDLGMLPEYEQMGGDETRWRSLASRATELLARQLGGSTAVPANTHRDYPLALRYLAMRAAATGEPQLVRAWYEAARRFESLPAARRVELMAPSAWWQLWRGVLERVDDAEERARQEDRYRAGHGVNRMVPR